eukprot:6071467-Amphidinium_carterae.1
MIDSTILISFIPIPNASHRHAVKLHLPFRCGSCLGSLLGPHDGCGVRGWSRVFSICSCSFELTTLAAEQVLVKARSSSAAVVLALPPTTAVIIIPALDGAPAPA